MSAILILFYLKKNSIPFDSSKKVLYIIIFGIANGLLSTKTQSLGNMANIIKPVVLMVCSILVIKYFLDIGFVKSIVTFSLLVISMGIGNAAVLLVFGFFIKYNVAKAIVSNTILYILSNIIVLAVTLLFFSFARPFSKIIRQIINNKELASALVLTILIMSANASLYYFVRVYNTTAFFINTAMSLIYYVYVIFICGVIYRKQIEKSEKEQQDFYNKSLESSLFNLRRFKHDWDNNLSVLNAMLTMKKYDEAGKYLHEIMEFDTSSNNTSIFNIKNAGLFGIISSKQKLAREKGLNIEINGTGEIGIIPEMKISELCEVIGIFLDNAIEESEKVHENIELGYLNSDKSLEISVKNKCNTDIDLSTLSGRSDKGPERGNGLRIVDHIVRKCSSVQNFRSYDNSTRTFEQLIIIEKGL
jgi:two-component system sensor histidine kinase AgrC